MSRWPFRCRGCDNDPHTFHIGPWRVFLGRDVWRSTGRKRWRWHRVITVHWSRDGWLPGSRELWPNPRGPRHPMWKSAPLSDSKGEQG